VWGSDFYRSSNTVRKCQKKIYDCADIITFTNEKTLHDFNDYYNHKYNSKLRIARFGLSVLDELKKLNIDKSNCRNRLGLSQDEIIVTVGYNNIPAQQHGMVIQSLKKLKNSFPSNLFLLFPLTYGGTKEYREQIREQLKQSGFRYKMLDSFLSDEEVAMVRKASDIMIQVQKTDQFSGSMQEHLYAKNIVITGDWLPYDILDERGVFMLKVSSVDEVGNKLLYAINNMDKLKNKCLNNPKIIWELSSWENNIQSWVDMYEELLRRER